MVASALRTISFFTYAISACSAIQARTVDQGQIPRWQGMPPVAAMAAKEVKAKEASEIEISNLQCLARMRLLIFQECRWCLSVSYHHQATGRKKCQHRA